MGIFSKKESVVNTVMKTNVTIKSKSARDSLVEVLQTMSGKDLYKQLKYSIFHKIVAFKGITEGIGTSTLVANTAIALAEMGLSVCVIDTSIAFPVQYDLLKVNFRQSDKDKKYNKRVEDWFSLGFTKESVLYQSTIKPSISVLGFVGRGITDMISTSDVADYVSLAYSQLSTKFDIILVDVSNELTTISSEAMLQAHKVIQLWTDAPHVMRNIESYLRNLRTLAIGMDKMQYVISASVTEDVKVNWEDILKIYKFKHLTTIPKDMVVSRVMTSGQVLYNYADKSEGITRYNDAVLDVVAHLVTANKTIKSGIYPNIHAGREIKFDNLDDFPEVSEVAREYAENGGEM